MLDKSKDLSEVDQITFNWERVKKRASSRREELVNNSPQVTKRVAAEPTVNTVAPASTPATRTTDTLTDPYANIAIQAKHMASSSNPTPPSEANTKHTTDIDNRSYIGNEINGTQSSQLLPRAPAQDESALVCDESLGSARNAVALLQGIKAKEIVGSELTMDERRLVVSSMKELGQTQDAISELLKVSRRTIVSDYKALRHEQALAIQTTDTNEIAGEVYEVAKTCIRRALQAGSFKTVSTIMRDMVEVLQSLGILYRAPKTSMQATMHGDIPGRHTGYHKYMDGIAGDKTKVVEVLDCMFDAIGNDQIHDQ